MQEEWHPRLGYDSTGRYLLLVLHVFQLVAFESVGVTPGQKCNVGNYDGIHACLNKGMNVAISISLLQSDALAKNSFFRKRCANIAFESNWISTFGNVVPLPIPYSRIRECFEAAKCGVNNTVIFTNSLLFGSDISLRCWAFHVSVENAQVR